MIHRIRIAIVALVLLAGAGVAQAQQVQWRHLDEPFGGSVYFFITAPNGTLYTSTEFSGMYRSSDEGATWSRFGSTSGLTLVLATTQNTLFAITDDKGGIFSSADEGATWMRTSEGATDVIPGFMVETSTGTIVMGTQRGIYRSTNAGGSWTNVGLDTVEFRFLAKSPEGTIFAASDDDGLFRSIDDGLTWTAVGNLQDSPADAFVFGTAGEIILGTDNGIYRSNDNGTSFSPFALTGDQIGPFGLGRLPNGDLIAASPGTGLHQVFSDGSSQRLFTAPASDLYTVVVTASGNIVLGYNGRGILRSIDQGATFESVGLPGGIGIRSFVESPDGTIYAILSSNGFYRTSDGGQTWSDLLLGEQSARYIDFSSTGTIYVAGAQGTAFRSSDNGATWTSLETGVGPDFSGVVVTASDVVIMTSNDGIIRSTDEGATWTPIVADENVYDIAESPDGTLTAIGFGKVYRSTNEGETWETIEVPEEHSGSSRFSTVVTPTTGVMVLGGLSSGNSEVTIRSTDNGTTWSEVTFPCSTFTFSPSTGVVGTIYASSPCGIYRSTDAGATWTLFANLPEGESFGSFLAGSDGNLWFGNRDGMYIGNPSSAVRAGNAGTSASLSLRLFPNPMQEEATAQFTLTSRQHVTLTLRTMLGETVAVLVDEPVEGGSHLIRFDRDLPSGSYLLHLRAGTNVASTMIQIVR